MNARSRKVEKSDRAPEHRETGADADFNSEPLTDDVGSDDRGEPASTGQSSTGDVATVKVKIAPAADVESTLERLHHVTGLRDIEPLFPGETHPELSKIFVAHVDANRMSETIPEVEADVDVEYVDKPAQRKLL